MISFKPFVEEVRNKVKTFLDGGYDEKNSIATPSELWSSVSSVLKYVLELSSEELTKIRFHSGYMTGSTDMFRFTYSDPDQNDVEKYVTDIGYRQAVAELPKRFWIGEPHEKFFLQQIGLKWRGLVVNSDITRYQECISDLWRAGVINKIEAESKRSTVLEIGGGYGGLAHQLMKVLGNYVTVVICDLPLTLFYAAVFLAHHNADKRILFYDGSEPDKLAETEPWDIILTPPEALETVLASTGCRIAINMQSFQEMTETQIRKYCHLSLRYGASALYSVNKERHPLNRDLTSLTELYESCGYVLFPSPNYYDLLFDRNNVSGYHTTRTYFVDFFPDQSILGFADFIPVRRIRTSPNPVAAYQI